MTSPAPINQMGESSEMTMGDAAVEVMREQGATQVWVGAYGLWEDIYERRYGEGGSGVRTRCNHPMNRAQAVFDGVRRSALFERAGYIRSIGFSDRERRHPVWRIAHPPLHRIT